jgi:hypothetical protein
MSNISDAEEAGKSSFRADTVGKLYSNGSGPLRDIDDGSMYSSRLFCCEEGDGFRNVCRFAETRNLQAPYRFKKILGIAAPIPLPAPVTSTRLSLNRCIHPFRNPHTTAMLRDGIFSITQLTTLNLR